MKSKLSAKFKNKMFLWKWQSSLHCKCTIASSCLSPVDSGPISLVFWECLVVWFLSCERAYSKACSCQDLFCTKCANLKVLFPDFVWSLPKILVFIYFVSIWQQSDKRQEILKQSATTYLFWQNCQLYG